MNQEPTIRDVLDAMQTFSSSVNEQFVRVDKRFTGLDKEIATIKATMVTKEYLDDKLTDLRGDLVALVRKGDRKLAAVVDELVKRQVFDEATARRIFELEPFAR
jgi:archaellum component FlaC